MIEPTNAVLAERVKQLQEDFSEFRKQTRYGMKDMEDRVEGTRKVADEVNFMVVHVKESVDKMERMMTNFVNVVADQNKSTNTAFEEQNKSLKKSFNDQNQKINDFTNSDSRMSHKRQLVVSVLQVGAGIFIAILSYWAGIKL